jgi:hypothetical protein
VWGTCSGHLPLFSKAGDSDEGGYVGGPGTRRGWRGVDVAAAFLSSLRQATTTEVLVSGGLGRDGATTARSRGMARGGSEGGEVNERKRGVRRHGLRHSVSLRGPWCKAEEERSASKDGRARMWIVGARTRMEGMRGGVWKRWARMEGRRGRRMTVGFASGDHSRGAREGGHGGRGGRGGAEPCTVWTSTLLS